jgi:hypothetical protein
MNLFAPYELDEFQVKNWNPLFLLSMPVVFLMLTVSGGGLSIFLFELGATDGTIASKADAAWLALMAASTVGFGHVYPVTDGGRISVGLIAALGICTFNAIGTFVSLWLFSRFDTEVQNRELRRQNAENILLNKEIIRTNLIAVQTNYEIMQTNLESIEGNTRIEVLLRELVDVKDQTVSGMEP